MRKAIEKGIEMLEIIGYIPEGQEVCLGEALDDYERDMALKAWARSQASSDKTGEQGEATEA